MRQVHHTGDTCFVDCAGKKPTIVDPTTGELIPVQLFGGVTNAVVCDQLKSSVVVPCPHARGLQRTYEDYGVAVLMLRSPRRIAAGR